MTPAIVWTVIAGIGTCFGVYNAYEAALDLRAVRNLNGDPGDAKALLARESLKTEASRLLTLFIFAAIGLYVIIGSTRPGPLARFFFTWGLVFAAALVSINSIRGIVIRHKLRAAIEAAQEMKGK